MQLTGVVVGEELPNSSDDEILEQDAARLDAVLHILKQFSPIKLATLWKLKERAESASAIARTKEYHAALDPFRKEDQTEFVCPWDGSHIALILGEYRKKILGGHSKGIVHIADVSHWKIDELATDDNFNTSERIERLGLKKSISIPFGSLCSPENFGQPSPNYLLNLYVSEYSDDEDVDCFIPTAIFDAVKAKLESGVCALIDRRLTRITNAITTVEMSKAGDGADFAIREALQRVLPKFIRCERVISIAPRNDGTFRQAMNKLILSSSEMHSEQSLSPLTVEELAQLAELAERSFDEKDMQVSTDRRRKDTVIVGGAELSEQLQHENFKAFRNVMIGRIHKRAEPDDPHGYVFLVNRINDLALRKHQEARIPDYFDWEDELYLNHICNILDFIAELFTAEEARFNRTHILAHELHAPTGFVYATAERILDWVDDQEIRPVGMVKRELSDILVTNDLQSALVDSLMIGLNTSDDPPAKKYVPTRTNLQRIADDTARTVMPICRKNGVPHSGIIVRSFPYLFLDGRAAKQIFLNILTNAIKYSRKEIPDKFNVTIFSEHLSIEELKTTNASEKFIGRLLELGVRHGYMVTFEDNGIGVPDLFKDRIFKAGTRADTDEVLAMTGAGLGLSVVKSIMNDHFGDIWLERAGSPTTFCLFFPDFLKTGSYRTMVEWQGGSK